MSCLELPFVSCHLNGWRGGWDVQPKILLINLIKSVTFYLPFHPPLDLQTPKVVSPHFLSAQYAQFCPTSSSVAAKGILRCSCFAMPRAHLNEMRHSTESSKVTSWKTRGQSPWFLKQLFSNRRIWLMQHYAGMRNTVSTEIPHLTHYRT